MGICPLTQKEREIFALGTDPVGRISGIKMIYGRKNSKIEQFRDGQRSESFRTYVNCPTYLLTAMPSDHGSPDSAQPALCRGFSRHYLGRHDPAFHSRSV